MCMHDSKIKKTVSFTDLSFPSVEMEKTKHKLKRIIPSPNSTFIGSECVVCKKANLIFSHSSKQRKCKFCFSTLTNPKGGKCLTTRGISITKKDCLIIRKFTIIW
uniref:Ribosomal protein S27 n=1 Tax=Lotharella vacuolata TaxID=74820 RepID=A0A0H5BQW8_9EUKA|nr:ribosomal protein S27 [Lotharella vacuolata]